MILIFAIRLIDLGDLRILCPVASAPRKSNQLSLTPAQEIKFMGPIERENKSGSDLTFALLISCFEFVFLSLSAIMQMHNASIKKVCEKVLTKHRLLEFF